MASPSVSPIRRLYATLVSLDSEDGVHENLLTHADYREMGGDPAPRFCEWAYHRQDHRKLVEGLLGAVLRPTDARRLALSVGLSADALKGLGTESIVREALRLLGVNEPTPPRNLKDGVDDLSRYRNRLDEEIKATNLSPGRNEPIPVELGRKGAERLLKVLCFFLWDNGYADVIRQVVSEGRHGFRAAKVRDWETWLTDGDLGTFNFLLNAVSAELKQTGVKVHFLGGSLDLWPSRAFQAVTSLCQAFQTVVHDTQTGARFEPVRQRRLQVQFEAVEKALECIHSVGPPIWRPRVIQFYRRTDDGHSIHHEGLDENGTEVRFFESVDRYELHVPYLFVAATNPSAVDVACCKLRESFERPV